MKLSIAALLLVSSTSTIANALISNPPEAPQVLSDTTTVCSESSGRTSVCEVELDVPFSCVTPDGSSACPIVFFFHGAGGTNDWFARTSGVHDANMIGVYPQGENGWNTGPKASNVCEWDDFACTSDPDEGAFIALIISELRVLGANGNVYLNGNSNGAALAMRLAANAGDDLPIKGIIAKVTQLLEAPDRSGPGVLNNNQPRGPGPTVSILNIMGTNDGVIPYEGGSSSVFENNNSFQLMNAIDSMATWASYNSCSSSDPAVSTVNYSNSADANGEAIFYEYGGCPDGVVVEHYACIGAGHSLGRNAALDGVNIDYDMAFQFINRLEGGVTLPAPTPPAPTPPAACEDDPAWSGKFNSAHTCDYVAEAPSNRCRFESADGTLASEACKETCDSCDTASPPALTTSAPPPPVACEDDPAWSGMFNPAHNCDYVAQAPERRCGWQSSDSTLASVACKVSCGEC